MQVDLRGMGDDTSTGIDFSSFSSGLSGQSPVVLLGLGALGLWLMSSLFSGGKKAYGTVTRPIKRRRKRRAELAEAEEGYRMKRQRIERAYSK